MTDSGMPKGRILIVDDDEDFLEMAESFLEGDYETALAASGRGALELLAGDYTPDLILLDVSMPDMNGYETLRNIRALGNAAGVPVMFLTGVNETAAELRGLELGAVDYITKPFVKEILLKRLELHLKQGRELAALYRERRKKKKPLSIPPLTPWERKIALLAQKRLSGGEIAEAMGTTGRTIRTALSFIYMKLNIHSKRELADLDLESDR
ncbi:MAG: DNA-binding response regulator [Treponema sp.]|jgi:DNA-binding NarL/FixJ family response regulator|nr:DNA-binding response regulator [Treponema sp.]